ncbi:MAG: hypothetical protein RIQ37_513 [Actinomycetota bacterium]|jgi:uncharacterized membrane protein YhaH (DUF805 family)
MSKKVNFVEAIGLGFRNYTKFKGTASRSEFWYWTLFTVLLSMVLGTLESAIWRPAPTSGDWMEDLSNLAATPTPLTSIASIVLFLPNLAVTARRFRDAGFSAKWLFASIVPGLYAIFALIGVVVIAGGTDVEGGFSTEQWIPVIFLVVPIFALIAAVAIMFLIFTLKPTRSFYDGNKYAEPQPLSEGDVNTTA